VNTTSIIESASDPLLDAGWKVKRRAESHKSSATSSSNASHFLFDWW
jgi:hypothetical protein